MTEPRDAACPFLVGSGGGWRADRPDPGHRCAAVTPAAALATDKQRRLCLGDAHGGCATYQAAVRLREERAGDAATGSRAGRWGYARQIVVVERETGPSGRLRDWLAGPRAWQVVPAVVLGAVVVALAASGGGRPNGGASGPTPTPTPTAGPTASVTPATTSTAAPTPTAAPSPTASPTASPTLAPTPTPAPSSSYRTYIVKSGDTLYGIARSFGVSLNSLLELNGISRTHILHAGDVLLIPNP